MSKLLTEFRDFINRGNVMDMAVGVIVGGAFTAIVTSLTGDIIQPFITLLTGGNDPTSVGLTIPVAGTKNGIDFGSFLAAVLNFIIVAFIVFMLVKLAKKAQEMGKKAVGKTDEAPAAPAPICPHCLEEVKEGATRCPHCAGVIEPAATSAQ